LVAASNLRERVRGRLAGENGINEESLVRHKDGSFSVTRGFFYRMGKSEEDLAERLKEALPEATVVEMKEHWRAWPKHSYWQVRFTVPQDLGMPMESMTKET